MLNLDRSFSFKEIQKDHLQTIPDYLYIYHHWYISHSKAIASLKKKEDHHDDDEQF